MPEKPQSQSLAVLIDADNTSARHAHAIFEEIVKLGEANVRRIYGDFSGTRLAGWNKQIQSLAIIARHPRSYDREDMVFDPIHYLPLLEHKIGALDQAARLGTRHGRCFSVSGCARYPTVVTAFHRSSSSMPSGSIAVSR